jgi:hypothetical protein
MMLLRPLPLLLALLMLLLLLLLSDWGLATVWNYF